jgi:filamentous hemagglutinin family protein
MKLSLDHLFLALACCYGLSAQANPIGAQIVNGTANINQNGNLLTITNSPNAIINWQGFSIGSGETTNIIQQSVNSSILNRVIGADPSALLGTMTSNGKVFLINPAGIMVGQGARIDVGGLVASTLNLSNANFLAGKLNFHAQRRNNPEQRQHHKPGRRYGLPRCAPG